MVDIKIQEGDEIYQKVKAYNARADYIYRNYKMNKFIVIKGKIRNDGSIKIF